MPRIGFLALSIAAAASAGCGGAIVRSQHLQPLGEASGFVYYLPKQLLKVEISRTRLPSDLTDRFAQLRAQSAALRTAQETRSAELDRLQTAVTLAPQGSPERAELERQSGVLKALVEADGKHLAATNNQIAAIGDQLRRYQDAKFEQPKYRDEIRLTLLPPVADTTQRYVANIDRRGGMRSDNIQLKSNAAGLLTTGDVQSVDQTGQFLVEIISSLGSAARTAESLKVDTDVGASTADMGCNPYRIEMTVDPTSTTELNSVASQIPRPCPTYAFTHGDHPDWIVPGTRSGGEPSGIYYRRKLPVVLNITDGTKVVQSVQFEIPNRSPAERLPLDGVALAQADHDFVLENGMLTEHRAVLPSSALEVAKAPGRVLSAIAAIPTSLIQLKIDTTKKETELTKEELAYLIELGKLEAERARRAGETPPDSE